jgi:hypothetical protein
LPAHATIYSFPCLSLFLFVPINDPTVVPSGTTIVGRVVDGAPPVGFVAAVGVAVLPVVVPVAYNLLLSIISPFGE